jgi:putative copper resistance protein D
VVPLTMSYFNVHVLQHLILMVGAPPLLALGAPSTLLLQTSARRTKARWLSILHSRPFAVVSHPLSSFFLYFGVMTIFFLTPLINTAMHHQYLMDAMNLLFLLGATLYWWPMIGIDPIVHWKMTHGARMMNILLGSAVEAFLGIAIIAETHPIASMYSVAATHSGGALLWVSTEFVTLGAFIPIYLQWTRSEDRAARRADRALEYRHRLNLELQEELAEMPIEERSLTPWELEWIARTGRAPQEMRLTAQHLEGDATET